MTCRNTNQRILLLSSSSSSLSNDTESYGMIKIQRNGNNTNNKNHNLKMRTLESNDKQYEGCTIGTIRRYHPNVDKLFVHKVRMFWMDVTMSFYLPTFVTTSITCCTSSFSLSLQWLERQSNSLNQFLDTLRCNPKTFQYNLLTRSFQFGHFLLFVTLLLSFMTTNFCFAENQSTNSSTKDSIHLEVFQKRNLQQQQQQQQQEHSPQQRFDPLEAVRHRRLNAPKPEAASLTQIKEYFENLEITTDPSNSTNSSLGSETVHKMSPEEQMEKVQLINQYHKNDNDRVRNGVKNSRTRGANGYQKSGQELSKFIKDSFPKKFKNLNIEASSEEEAAAENDFDMMMSMLTDLPVNTAEPQTAPPSELSPTNTPQIEGPTNTPSAATPIPTPPFELTPTNTPQAEGTPLPTLIASARLSIVPTPEDQQSRPQPTGTPLTSEVPSTSPTKTVAPSSAQDLCLGTPRSEAILDVLRSVSDEDLLLDSTTAQGMAFLWIVEEDPLQLDPCKLDNSTIISSNKRRRTSAQTSNIARIQQRYALVVFYYSTSGDSWRAKSGWLSGTTECEWMLISCHQGGSRNGFVSSLQMSRNELIGSIPEEISAFEYLEVIDFFDNSLAGTFPPAMTKLTLLTRLDVEENDFNGNPLDVLNTFVNIRELRLSSNTFSGTWDRYEFSKFTNLRELWIRNNIFDGVIPEGIGSLRSLESLLISDNEFRGLIPTSFGALRLREFSAQNNQLEGPIPNELFNNIDLRQLRLDSNKLTGTLSTVVGDLVAIRDLRINDNEFTGSLPVTLWSLNTLEILSVSNNKFTGRLRDNFNLFRNLDYIDFSQNEFEGTIPPSLFEIPTIRLVYMNNNKLQGPIPENYGVAPRLRDFYIYDNLLQGEIPPIQQGQLTALQEYLMQNNDLTGIMPPSICALRIPNGNGILEDLWADCSTNNGLSPSVECECCTQCIFAEP